MSTPHRKGQEVSGPPAEVPPPTPEPIPGQQPPPPAASATRARELGGAPGPEPTRFGDWEKNGRCIDF